MPDDTGLRRNGPPHGVIAFTRSDQRRLDRSGFPSLRAGVASQPTSGERARVQARPEASAVQLGGFSMRTTLSTFRASLLVGAVAGLLTVPAASAAAVDSQLASAAAASLAGTPISSLPFYGSGDVTGAGTGTRGTVVANAAVATACNGGTPISGQQWYTLPAATLG